MVEPSYLAAIRRSYDTVCDEYARVVKAPAELDPLSRSMLGAFAELVRVADRGPVADLGCGPGQVTAYLASLGLAAFGVDLSPRMIESARRAHPELRFVPGSMTALDIANDELGGILCYFVIHHTPPECLPMVFAEFARTLAPGGWLMLGDYIGDGEQVRPIRAYGGHPVSYASYFLPAEQIVGLLGRAGLVVTARLECEPGDGVKRRHAVFLARKPGAEHAAEPLG
ncbi:class I SAM-dependent methyltransferase [Embleya sp. NPDC005971]|uniref:class I SAM-dependent methyltransferase n=1 Tax=Embleya sp. NPDC005971 TaxID=3156724 RepID=UPI0033FCE068